MAGPLSPPTTAPVLLKLDGVIRDYPWGSPTAIPQLLGIEVTGEPAAELWIGAHPGAPSPVAAGDGAGTLLDAVSADPALLLGAAALARYGAQLPFLLKLLAAARPLSIQAHPSAEQARAGFAREDAAGIARDAAHRNYRDASHKPELICALTPFTGLCGLREPQLSADLLQTLAVPGLDPVLVALRAGDLRGAVGWLWSVPQDERADLVAALEQPLARVVRTGGAWAAECAWVARIAREYPADMGVPLALLLNLVRLRPGEAVFLGAGQLHAYLEGFGVEIMAASDNVLRCGLTTKHVDAAELMDVASFAPAAPHLVAAVAVSETEVRYPVPVSDFLLSRVEVGPGQVVGHRARGPVITLCTAGTVTVSAGDRAETISAGAAVFVGDSAAWSIQGAGTAYVAGTGPADPG